MKMVGNPLPSSYGECDGVDGTLMDTIKDFISRDARVKELEDELKTMKANHKLQASRIAELMAADGVERVSVDGRTVYRKTNRRVNKHGQLPMEDACEYLKRVELEYLVKPSFSTQTLRSIVVDLLDEGKELPERFHDFFNVYEEHTVGMRAS